MPGGTRASRAARSSRAHPHIRAYLGVPLLGVDGHALGTLCVLDRRVRAFTPEERQIVERHARAVGLLIRR